MDPVNSRVSQEPRDQGTEWIGPNERGVCIPPRHDFVPVLSRVLGTLFIVGGKADTGENTGEIWAVTASASPVLLAVPGYAPRRVMAATVGLRDRMLWVLDEGDGSPNSTSDNSARLVRIDPYTGDLHIVWEGQRSSSFDKHWLTVDNDRRVLLTSSSESLGRHVTVKFDSHRYVMHSARPIATHHAEGYLATPPVVDEHGYFFAAQDSEGRFQPVRVESLNQNHPNGIDLGMWL